MFIRGLGDVDDYTPLDVSAYETPEYGYDISSNTYGGVVGPSTPVLGPSGVSPSGASGGSDWTAFFSNITKAIPDVAKAYTQIKATDAQTQLQLARQYQYPYGATMTAGGLVYPQSYPVVGNNGIFGIPAPLAIGGLALLAYMLARN